MKKGFTLIELLVVVAIIGILAFIMLNAFFGKNDKEIHKPQIPNSYKEDKFTTNLKVDTSKNIDVDYNHGKPPTPEEQCSDAPDEYKSDCLRETRNAELLRECVERYSND